MRPIDADELLDAICRDQCERKYKDCDYTCSEVAYVVNAPTLAKDIHVPNNGWISVKDRMPEENVAVNIVWMNTDPESYYEDIKDKPFAATGVYFRGEWYWWSSVVQDYLAEYGVGFTDKMDKSIIVTHWMPLPEPPKEESAESDESDI